MNPLNFLISLFIIYIIAGFAYMLTLTARIEKLEHFKREVDEAADEFRD